MNFINTLLANLIASACTVALPAIIAYKLRFVLKIKFCNAAMKVIPQNILEKTRYLKISFLNRGTYNINIDSIQDVIRSDQIKCIYDIIAIADNTIVLKL